MTPANVEELASRSGDGVAVALLWNRKTNALRVRVDDARTGDSFSVAVDAADALDAFHHPYAYAARAGVHFLAGQREPVYA